MLAITHTTPRRLLAHLRRLQRAGEALLARLEILDYFDEIFWDIRVWKCLDKIVIEERAFEAASALDAQERRSFRLDSPVQSQMMNELIRRRISRRIVTLASVIEKVEAIAELPGCR